MAHLQSDEDMETLRKPSDDRRAQQVWTRGDGNDSRGRFHGTGYQDEEPWRLDRRCPSEQARERAYRDMSFIRHWE